MLISLSCFLFFIIKDIHFLKVSLILFFIIDWQSVGVDFPPHEENSIALFTPPQIQPVGLPASTDSASTYEEAVAFQDSLQSDPSGLE